MDDCISYTHAANKSPNSTCPSRFLWVQVLARNGGQSYPFQLRSKTLSEQTPLHEVHMDRKATREEIQHNKGPNFDHWQVGPESSPTEEREGRWAQLGGRPTTLVGRPAHGPHRLQAPCGCSPLASYVGSRRDGPNSRPWRGWFSSINMRGGAPFQGVWEMERIEELEEM